MLPGTVYGVADAYQRLSDDVLLERFARQASERHQRFRITDVEGEWVAAFLGDSGFGGEAVLLSVNGPDRRTAMVRLAVLLDQDA